MTDSTWTLAYDHFDPAEERLREALTSTGNGYFSTRGSFSWTEADEVHYPGTYMHGGFNRETTIMAGVPVLNEDLVNLPNWLLLALRIEGEEAVGMENVEVLSYRHRLDIKRGLLERSLAFRDRAGRETTVRTRIYRDGQGLDVERDLYQMEDYIHQEISFTVEEKTPVRVEKMVAFYSSRDRAINEPLVNAEKAVVRFGTFDEALERHARAWEALWSACDVRVPGDDKAQMLLRLHVYHILQVCSPHTADLDAGVPARGLNGEAYRGHIFWDELYIYPFLNFRL